MVLRGRIRTGSDSIYVDQDWTRTEKFHSPLISATYIMVDWLCDVTGNLSTLECPFLQKKSFYKDFRTFL